MKKLLILLILCSCTVKHRAAMTYNWNHPRFAKYDTVLNTHTHLLYTIVQPQLRPDKHQLFYTGVSMSHNDTVQFIPENSIKKVRLWWDDNGAHVEEVK